MILLVFSTKLFAVIALSILVLLAPVYSMPIVAAASTIKEPINPSLNPAFKSQAVNMSLTWLNTYFKEDFRDLYNYIEKYNLSTIKVEDTSDLLRKRYTVTLSELPLEVSVDFVVTDGKLVLDGFSITAMIPPNYYGECDLKELSSIIKKYNHFNATRVAYDYLVNYYGLKFKHKGFRIVPVLDYNRSDFMLIKDVGILIQLRYGGKIVAETNSKGTDISRAAVAGISYWWGPSIFSYKLIGLSDLYEFAEMINRMSMVKKPIWKYDRSTVVEFLSKKLYIDEKHVDRRLEEYIVITTNGTLRPVYYLKYVKGDIVKRALVYADTGEAFISIYVESSWGSSSAAPRSIAYKTYINEPPSKTSRENEEVRRGEIVGVSSTTTTTTSITTTTTTTTTTRTTPTTTSQHKQEVRNLVNDNIAVLLAAIIITLIPILIMKRSFR